MLEKQLHEKHIMDLQMSPDLTHFITASNDRSAKLVDTNVRMGVGGWGGVGGHGEWVGCSVGCIRKRDLQALRVLEDGAGGTVPTQYSIQLAAGSAEAWTLVTKPSSSFVTPRQHPAPQPPLLRPPSSCTRPLLRALCTLQSLEVMKTYQSTVPVNSAALSPIFDHVSAPGPWVVLLPLAVERVCL